MALQWFVDECESISNVSYDVGTAPVKSLASSLKRGYWPRVWIVQEFLLARLIDLQHGRAVVVADRLAAICLVLQPVLPHSPAIDLIKQRTATLRDDSLLQGQTLEALIRTYSSSECSDRRDKVFALLPLAADCASGNGMKPDYGIARFSLLMQALEFCRPEDPVEFISLLLRFDSRYTAELY